MRNSCTEVFNHQNRSSTVHKITFYSNVVNSKIKLLFNYIQCKSISVLLLLLGSCHAVPHIERQSAPTKLGTQVHAQHQCWYLVKIWCRKIHTFKYKQYFTKYYSSIQYSIKCVGKRYIAPSKLQVEPELRLLALLEYY